IAESHGGCGADGAVLVGQPLREEPHRTKANVGFRARMTDEVLHGRGTDIGLPARQVTHARLEVARKERRPQHDEAVLVLFWPARKAWIAAAPSAQLSPHRRLRLPDPRRRRRAAEAPRLR